MKNAILLIIFSFIIGEEMQENNMELATLGAGCFWCVEAVFDRMEGVVSVMAGYAGGHTENPNYNAVCSGKTGHAEVAQIEFNPAKISYEEVLDIFWISHDPTTLNRQGADVGTQYRSAIFYHNEIQRNTAEDSRKLISKSQTYSNPIVTEISYLEKFYPAENYHQDYYRLNQDAPYCQFVIRPKLEKLKAVLDK